MMTKIKQHILNTEFKLKDFNKCFEKYKNYKKDFANKFFKDNKEHINNHLIDLKDLIKQELDLKDKQINIINIYFSNGLNKKSINMFRTLINSITYKDINLNFICDLNSLLNKNEINSLAIILYLRNYDKINNIMKDFFKDYLLNLERRIMLRNLN